MTQVFENPLILKQPFKVGQADELDIRQSIPLTQGDIKGIKERIDRKRAKQDQGWQQKKIGVEIVAHALGEPEPSFPGRLGKMHEVHPPD